MREIGGPRGVAEVLDGPGGWWRVHRGDLEAARALHEESLAILRELDNKASMAESLYLLGDLARDRGDLDQARALWEECRAMDQAAGVRGGYVLMALAEMAQERGEYAEAARLLGIRLREIYEIGQVQTVGDLLQQLAGLFLAMNQPERAARLWGASAAQEEALARRRGSNPARGEAHGGVTAAARAALGEERFAAAWACGRAMALEMAIAGALEGAPPSGDPEVPPS
jgi:tetratricopeptide (TPR) repeat protein